MLGLCCSSRQELCRDESTDTRSREGLHTNAERMIFIFTLKWYRRALRVIIGIWLQSISMMAMALSLHDFRCEKGYIKCLLYWCVYMFVSGIQQSYCNLDCQSLIKHWEWMSLKYPKVAVVVTQVERHRKPHMKCEQRRAWRHICFKYTLDFVSHSWLTLTNCQITLILHSDSFHQWLSHWLLFASRLESVLITWSQQKKDDEEDVHETWKWEACYLASGLWLFSSH